MGGINGSTTSNRPTGGLLRKKFRKSRSIRVPIFFARVDLLSSLPFLMTSDYEQDHPFVLVEPPGTSTTIPVDGGSNAPYWRSLPIFIVLGCVVVQW